MVFSAMASQTLILKSPIFPSTRNHTAFPIVASRNSLHRQYFRFPTQKPSLSLSVSGRSSKISAIGTNPTLNRSQIPIQSDTLLTGSTRTVTTLIAIALAASKCLSQKMINLASQDGFRQALISTAGPAFFASFRDRVGTLNAPFTVVAAGLAKWLDIYSGVLMVCVLLSWFPNIPWDKQPLSAIRSLCDPYLNLFRNIIPPIYGTMDVSPILAFGVLGALGSILNSRRGY